MKIFIYVNKENKNAYKDTLYLMDIFKKYNYTVFLDDDINNLYFKDDKYKADMKNIDYIVSLGGDGTVLKAARLATNYNIPLIGINNGRLGYLCAFDLKELDNISIDDFNKLRHTKRSILSYTHEGKESIAINDIIISKNHPGRTIELELSLNDIKKTYIRGDGLCIATPTGSSAYNLSCGGSIISENVDAFSICPICAHLSISKPLIVSGSDKITVEVKNASLNDAYVICDGEIVSEVKSKIEITKSDKSFTLLTK